MPAAARSAAAPVQRKKAARRAESSPAAQVAEPAAGPLAAERQASARAARPSQAARQAQASAAAEALARPWAWAAAARDARSSAQEPVQAPALMRKSSQTAGPRPPSTETNRRQPERLRRARPRAEFQQPQPAAPPRASFRDRESSRRSPLSPAPRHAAAGRQKRLPGF